MADCVFCKILAGEFAAQKIFESDKIVAILDINPVSLGHALVMPREHFETLSDLPPELAAELSRASQKVAQGVLKATGAEGFNLLMNNRKCAGQAILHAHFHVIPRRSHDGIKFSWPTRRYTDEMKQLDADLALAKPVPVADQERIRKADDAAREKQAEAIRAALR